MISAKQIERRKAILRAKGVPEKFVEPLATRKNDPLRQGLGLGLLVAVAVIYGFAFWQVSAMNRISAALHAWFYGQVQPDLFFSPTVFFDWFTLFLPNCALIAALIVGLAVWGTFFPERVRPWPAYSPTAASLRMLGRNQTLKSTKPRAEYQQLGYLSSEVAFIEALIRNRPALYIKSVLRITLIFAVVFGILGVLAAQDYVRITGSRIEMHHAWGTRMIPFSEVKRVESSCQAYGKGAGYRYTLVLPGKRLELFPAPSVTLAQDRRDLLQRLGRLDQALQALRVSDVSVGPKGETADQYNACVTAWRTKTGVGDLPFPQLAHPF